MPSSAPAPKKGLWVGMGAHPARLSVTLAAPRDQEPGQEHAPAQHKVRLPACLVEEKGNRGGEKQEEATPKNQEKKREEPRAGQVGVLALWFTLDPVASCLNELSKVLEGIPTRGIFCVFIFVFVFVLGEGWGR